MRRLFSVRRGAVFSGWALAALTVGAPAARADLRSYVEAPDPSYAFAVETTERAGEITYYQVRMTSQTWRGHPWRHWLTVAVPDKPESRTRGLLLITGGSSESARPSVHDEKEDSKFRRLIEGSRCVAAVLRQVPNQPIFDLKEDALIAHTFDHYVRGGGDDWPLLFPMAKSAVRAMDTVQALASEKAGLRLGEFTVTGASKRGWTTWLTGVVDPRRATALAPMVIDMLNMEAQMDQQVKSYGKYSEQVDDYSERDIMSKLTETGRGRRLMGWVDPFSYRAALRQPKLVLLGANDPYWTVDSANLYFGALEGSKRLHYLANAGHGLGEGSLRTLLAFVRTQNQGGSLPSLEWAQPAPGTLEVRWGGGAGRPRLWVALAESRDFRKSEWTAHPLTAAGNTAQARVPPPAAGWAAGFVEVTFEGPDGPYGLTTGMTVVPETFPHPEGRKGQKKIEGKPGRKASGS